MLWDSVSDSCGVCECSNMISSGFNLSEKCCNGFRRNSCLDKENIQERLGSPLKSENDLSLYSTLSPDRSISCSQSSHCSFRRRPLEDHDTNSQDSGYGASYIGDNNKFYRFAKSLGVTPRNDESPPKSTKTSFGSIDSMDAEFLELSDLDNQLEENTKLPSDFNTLIDDVFPSVKSKEISPEYNLSFRPLLRRSVSLNIDGSTPNTTRVRSCLFQTGDIVKSFKRPEPPIEELSPLMIKRSRFLEEDESNKDEREITRIAPVPQRRPILQKSVSVSEESIKFALHRSSTEPDLIGDFSISFCLPLISGRHQDLKSITPNTLMSLMKGEFDDSVASYKIIDCRYPYEYEGGHIAGSTNFYTKDQILEQLLTGSNIPTISTEGTKRHILVFHCEFSSERAPNLYRFLRNLDRIRNKDFYPALHYPEVYLLEGGYKCFYEQFSDLCVPEAYKPMKHPAHQNDFRHFRAKSKTFNGDRVRSSSRGSLKRLGIS